MNNIEYHSTIKYKKNKLISTGSIIYAKLLLLENQIEEKYFPGNNRLFISKKLLFISSISYIITSSIGSSLLINLGIFPGNFLSKFFIGQTSVLLSKTVFKELYLNKEENKSKSMYLDIIASGIITVSRNCFTGNDIRLGILDGSLYAIKSYLENIGDFNVDYYAKNFGGFIIENIQAFLEYESPIRSMYPNIVIRSTIVLSIDKNLSENNTYINYIYKSLDHKSSLLDFENKNSDTAFFDHFFESQKNEKNFYLSDKTNFINDIGHQDFFNVCSNDAIQDESLDLFFNQYEIAESKITCEF